MRRLLLAAVAAVAAALFAAADAHAGAAVLRAAGDAPNDPFWSLQWSAQRTNAPAAWKLSTGSPNIVVAVLDTGVDATHPDLRGKLVPGWDFVNGDAEPADDHGHGTAVAGIVGAASANAEGIVSFCWRCSIMPVKVLGADGSGTHEQVAAGIRWAVDRGARVLNLSLGGSDSSTTLAGAVAYARERGAMVVAAAGNAGLDAVSYPAAYPGVVAVAATDEADALYGWSNRGSAVAVAAPGTNFTTLAGGGYGSFAGTSSATPVVAGIAALGLAWAPSAAADAVTRALTSTAAAVDGVSAGRVDAYRTLTALRAPVATAAARAAKPTNPARAKPRARR